MMYGMERAQDALRKAGIHFLTNEPMSKRTTLRLGGPADVFCTPRHIEELRMILAIARETGTPLTVIGQGSNLLVLDGGIRGIVVKADFQQVTADDMILKAGAGCMLHRLSEVAAAHSLAGLAFASGIPGTVGGAVYMNAGAYGGEISQVFRCAHGLTMDGEETEMTDLHFSYRHSDLQDGSCIVTEVTFSLQKGDKAEIRKEMSEYQKKREEKQPLGYPSAGSTFKRPEGDYAARLIDSCGLRGLKIGGAQVSEKHAGFLLNLGGTAKDFISLMQEVQKRVYLETGILLEPEVRILGEE